MIFEPGLKVRVCVSRTTEFKPARLEDTTAPRPGPVPGVDQPESYLQKFKPVCIIPHSASHHRPPPQALEGEPSKGTRTEPAGAAF
eukprot:SAG11_NODE_315_length_10858_cov_14.578977_6_plen_86_part_00